MTYRGRNNTDPEGCERAQLRDGCQEITVTLVFLKFLTLCFQRMLCNKENDLEKLYIQVVLTHL